MTSLGDDVFSDGYAQSGGAQGNFRYVPPSGNHHVSRSSMNGKHMHGGAVATVAATFSSSSNDESSLEDRLENAVDSAVLTYEQEGYHAMSDFGYADQMAGKHSTYTAVLNIDFKMVLRRGSGSTTTHISQDELRDLIESNMTKTDAYWVKEFPRHLLEHAFVDQFMVKFYSSPHQTGNYHHSLLLLSNVPSLNNHRYYTDAWESKDAKSVDVVLVQSGYEAKVEQASEAETYFHLNPMHCRHAAHGHESSLFFVKSSVKTTGDFYIFRKNSIYDNALQEIIESMPESNLARVPLSNFYNDEEQRRTAKLLVHTKETKHIDLSDFRIVAASAVDRWVRPKVMMQLKGEPLGMFREGLKFHLTTDLSTPEAIDYLAGRSSQSAMLSASPLEHHASVHLALTLVFPLPFTNDAEAIAQ